MKERHEELHRALDELLACYLTETKALISNTTLMTFLKWSHQMTENPTCQRHQAKEPKSG